MDLQLICTKCNNYIFTNVRKQLISNFAELSMKRLTMSFSYIIKIQGLEVDNTQKNFKTLTSVI